MIRPKYLCNDCIHKHICKYVGDMSNLIQSINEKCDYSTNDLPINLSHITCDYLTTNPKGGIIR